MERIANIWLQTCLLSFPGMSWSSHVASDYSVHISSRKFCKRDINSFKTLF